MFRPAPRPAGPRNRVELNRVNCGDDLERRPLASAVKCSCAGPPTERMARRHGNADLWPAAVKMQSHAGTPTVQMVPSARERRPLVGTAARSAAKGVYHAAVRMTLNTEVPAEKGPPRNWGSFPPPAFGGLCRPEVGVPLPARRSAWWRAAETCTLQGTALSCQAGCAGGRDHERFSRWGPARAGARKQR